MREPDASTSVMSAAAKFCQWLESPGDIHHAFSSTSRAVILAESERLAELAAKRPELMSLAGITVGVKDNICTEMYPTRMGSPLWISRGGFDARVVATMRDRGALIVGKTQTAELAVHDAPDTTHPLYPERQVGTSSSGSAVAVAVGSCDVALGTQTAGSIARPASFVGVRYIKPTFGLLPRTGVLKTTDDFDTVGLMGRSIDIISTTLRATIPDESNHPILRAALGTQRRDPRRLLIPQLHGDKELSPAYEVQLRAIVDQHPEIDGDVSLLEIPTELVMSVPHAHHVVYAWSIHYYLHEELAEERRSLAVRELYLEGADVSLSDLDRARGTLRMWRSWIRSQLQDAVLLEPATAAGAPLTQGGRELPDNNLLWTAAGLPTVGLPILRDEDGLTVSMQLVGSHYSDFQILKLADRIDLGSPELQDPQDKR